ncbi:hypothetical protein TIFTF001_039332 [Ficus carica]|uniref:PGG domain-containing protein n=1 Tax=Ficus carica TaxID=3494 RepID=A0AA88EAL8_FICCA|nr:hypothetical protein TIFTF001_039332 [Ficus carica]
MSLQVKIDNLFANAMKGQWDEVLKIYNKSPEVQKAKIAKSEDTTLHTAVSVGQTEIALELVEKSQEDTLELANAKGNTALHIAAALGDLRVCESMISKNRGLITFRNLKGETPLFLAALHEKREAFLYLYSLRKEDYLVRRYDGDTVLHAAISGEYFILSMQFVKKSMPPQFFPRYNLKHETPKEIFISTHTALTKEGGKWLVKTSESCSVVAALVATVAFTTSSTIPGGADQNTGIPLLLHKPSPSRRWSLSASPSPRSSSSS